MYINGLKYACSTCIKGHRSSHCNHVDRPLFEIRKKGRPVTQCTYCRDLRKTKQIHIKCTCNDKKADSQQQPQQSLLITQHRGSHVTYNDICQDKMNIRDTHNHSLNSHLECTCIPSNSITLSRPPSAEQSSSPHSLQNPPSQTFITTHHNHVTRENSSLMSPLCTTTAPRIGDNNQSYSWVLITSAVTNHNHSITPAYEASYSNRVHPNEDESANHNHHGLSLGCTFHKHSSPQRHLDGQPRIHKRRSISQKKPIRHFTSSQIGQSIDSPMSGVDTMSDYNTLSSPPSSEVSPQATADSMDMQFDYLGDELPILTTNGNHHENHFLDHLPDSEELAVILNNVLQKEIPSHDTLNSNDNMNTLMLNHENTLNASEMNNSPLYAGSSLITPSSHCGSFAPHVDCCKSVGSSAGESVVITITPLITSMNNTLEMGQRKNDYPMTTRIVTCHCGSQCSCPGCLVHSSKFYVDRDPRTGIASTNTISSASSSCYGSDEEDLASILNRNVFPNIR